jgi:hypothetical protein
MLFAQEGNGRLLLCREILRIAQLHRSDEACRKATPDVAVARECPAVPGMCTRLVPAHAGRAKAGNIRSPFAGLLTKPSDGLEQSTPSLPWNDSGNQSQRTATVFA